jgi:hypothetical protein
MAFICPGFGNDPHGPSLRLCCRCELVIWKRYLPIAWASASQRVDHTLKWRRKVRECQDSEVPKSAESLEVGQNDTIELCEPFLQSGYSSLLYCSLTAS